MVEPYLNIAEKARWGFAVVSGGRYFQVLPPRTGSVYHWVMAERAMPAQSPSRYAAVAALFAALEELMDDYRSLPDADHVRQWSEDADRITGEVARHLAVARARISAASPHDAR